MVPDGSIPATPIVPPAVPPVTPTVPPIIPPVAPIQNYSPTPTPTPLPVPPVIQPSAQPVTPPVVQSVVPTVPAFAKVLSILFYIASIFFIVSGALLTFVSSLAISILSSLGSASLVSGILYIVWGVLNFIAGRGLWSGKKWGKTLVVTMSGLYILFGITDLFLAGATVTTYISLGINLIIILYLLFSKKVQAAFTGTSKSMGMILAILAIVVYAGMQYPIIQAQLNPAPATMSGTNQFYPIDNSLIATTTVDTSNWKTYTFGGYQVSYPTDATISPKVYPNDVPPAQADCIEISYGGGYVDIFKNTSNPCNGSHGNGNGEKSVQENVLANGKLYNTIYGQVANDNSYSYIGFDLDGTYSVEYGFGNIKSLPLSDAKYAQIISGLKSILSTITATEAWKKIPNIDSLSPGIGPVGTQITVTGSGFLSSDNTINIDGKSFTKANSSDGTHITFSTQNIKTNSAYHDFSVTNANGTSNSSMFTVTH